MIFVLVEAGKNIRSVMGNNESKSLILAKEFLGKEVEVVIDRPLGSKHPKHGFVYEVNYGYVSSVKAPDGEDLDAYYLGTDDALEKVKGIVKAVIHRLDDDDDKLVVVPENINMTDDEIEKSIEFQEKWFDHQILR
jgi:inorganic pyrophosphatase